MAMNLITDKQDPYTDVAGYHLGMDVDTANIDMEQVPLCEQLPPNSSSSWDLFLLSNI